MNVIIIPYRNRERIRLFSQHTVPLLNKHMKNGSSC